MKWTLIIVWTALAAAGSDKVTEPQPQFYEEPTLEKCVDDLKTVLGVDPKSLGFYNISAGCIRSNENKPEIEN